MKVGVINFSGNVGKTTISRHLLAPRMNDAKVLTIETINSDGSNEDAMRGKQFGELQVLLQMMDDAVIDIGASNVEDFIKMMSQYKGSQEDFDYFVVPVVPAMKQQRDTISTIEALNDLRVPAKKIRVLFNQVEIGDDPGAIFSGLFEYQKAETKFTIKPDAVLHTSDIYPKLAGSSTTLGQILADNTDYKEKIKTTTDSAEKLRYAQLVALKRQAAGVTEELDAVFKTLFK